MMIDKPGANSTLDEKKAWLQAQVPGMPDGVYTQVAALWPAKISSPSEDKKFINRQVAIGSSTQDSKTRLRYSALIWNDGHPKMRLYIDVPPNGQAFLIERTVVEAVQFLSVEPPLPMEIRREIREHLRRYLSPEKLQEVVTIV